MTVFGEKGQFWRVLNPQAVIPRIETTATVQYAVSEDARNGLRQVFVVRISEEIKSKARLSTFGHLFMATLVARNTWTHKTKKPRGSYPLTPWERETFWRAMLLSFDQLYLPDEEYANELFAEVTASFNLQLTIIEQALQPQRILSPMVPSPSTTTNDRTHRFHVYHQRKQIEGEILQDMQKHFKDVSAFVMLVCGGIRECDMLNRLMFFSQKEKDTKLHLLRVGKHQNIRVPHLVSIRDSWKTLEGLIRERGFFLGEAESGPDFLMDSLVDIVSACLPDTPPANTVEYFLLEWLDSTTIFSHKYLTERVRIIDPSCVIFDNGFSPVFFFLGVLRFIRAN